jgi:hypothetical protein
MMSLLEQTPGLVEALKGEMTPKFLATRNSEGTPNVVPVISILPADDKPDTLFFGNFLLRKTIQNLRQDTRVGILVITQQLQGWVLQADFQEFQRTGTYVDRQMKSSLLRYNAYTGIRNAGVMHVRSLQGTFRISRLQVMKDYLLARLARIGGTAPSDQGATIPLPVRQEFNKMTAVKALTWVGEDGYPIVVPAISLQPARAQSLICWKGMRLPEPPQGALVATNILTAEAVSYQVKGRWAGGRRTGIIETQEFYAGGPPIPGGRLTSGS